MPNEEILLFELTKISRYLFVSYKNVRGLRRKQSFVLLYVCYIKCVLRKNAHFSILYHDPLDTAPREIMDCIFFSANPAVFKKIALL